MGAAEKDGVELISVVLAAGQRGRWADTIKLMDYGFSQYVNVTPIDLYAMNPITIQTTNYSLSDSDMGAPGAAVPTGGSHQDRVHHRYPRAGGDHGREPALHLPDYLYP